MLEFIRMVYETLNNSAVLRIFNDSRLLGAPRFVLLFFFLNVRKKKGDVGFYRGIFEGMKHVFCLQHGGDVLTLY